MLYDRKIKYLDYLENKERCRGAGFVKIEVRDNACNIAIQVSGLHREDTSHRQIFLMDEQREEMLGTIKLERGRGSYQSMGLDSRSMGSTGISYDRLTGIRIPLGSSREIYCAWKEGARKILSEAPSDEVSAVELPLADGISRPEEPRDTKYQLKEPAEEKKQAVEMQGGDSLGEARAAEMCREGSAGEGSLPEENALEVKSVQESPEKEKAQQEHWKKENFEGSFSDTEEMGQSQKAGEKRSGVQKPYMKLRENKWQQLSAIYPHIKPFQDERDYLSIGPADFVVLPERYYRMANNSFLLHGYYNYEHLILTRIEKRGRITYYIGVPGCFYERERQVALMFGFESFECREEPAKQGDFGYYMMRMEL